MGNNVAANWRFSLVLLGLVGALTVLYFTVRPEDAARPPVGPRAAVALPQDCKDHLVHGLLCHQIQGVCGDSFGREVCRYTCNTCGGGSTTTTVTSPTPDECKDHVSSDLTCAEVKGFCGDRFAAQLCPKFCGLCRSNNTSSVTTNPTQSSNRQSPTSPSTSSSPRCADHVGHGYRCSFLPKVCSDPYGLVLCPRHCAKCSAPSPSDSSSPSSVPPVDCIDYVTGGGFTCSQLPGICSASIGTVLCRQHCGLCSSSSTATSSSATAVSSATTVMTTTVTSGTTTNAQPCVDNVVYDQSCSTIPGICSLKYGTQICRRYCGVCTSTHTPPQHGPTLPPGSCVDHVGNGLTCKDLPDVCHDPSQLGPKVLCPKHCGECHVPTAQPPNLNPCHDHVIYDILCRDIKNVCHNVYMKAMCRKHCQLCQGHGHNVVLQRPPLSACYDKLGAGLRCSMIPGICADPEASLMCPHYCNLCGGTTTTTQPQSHTPTTTTTTKNPKSTATTTKATGTMSTSGNSSTSGASGTSNSGSGGGGCDDNLGDGLSCSSFPNVCSSAYAATMCPNTCGLCGQSTPTAAATTGGGGGLHKCVDSVGGGMDCQTLKAGNFCADHYSQIFCRKTCGHCTHTSTSSASTVVSATTTDVTVTSPVVCVDNTASCIDLQKAFPTLCNTSDGQKACPQFCRICNCKPRVNDSTCRDDAELAICSIPGFCQNDIAKVVCRKSCFFCEDGCVDRLQGTVQCTDLYGPGKPVATKSELCSHPLGIQECEATCDCPGFCPHHPVNRAG